MEPSLENFLGTMNINGQYQPLTLPEVPSGDEFDKILAGFAMFPDNSFDAASVLSDSNNFNEQNEINILINSSNDQDDRMALLGTHLSETSIDSVDILEMIESLENEVRNQEQEPLEIEQLQSTFIETYDLSSSYHSQQVLSSPLSVPVGSSPVESKAFENLISAQTCVGGQQHLLREAAKSKKVKNHHRRSTTVGPVDYNPYSSACEPCTSVQIQNNYAYQQQRIEYDGAEPKQIKILANPRSNFRPRTQNESKTSSHYLRCEDGIKPEYPTIDIPQTWFFQSDVNLIEVSLMGVDKLPHPYSLENKTSLNTYEDHALIFKQNDPNVLYFRLTNEDFQNGYKTFMIEFIKSKQDDVITKELIRSRQLEHSALRFTRIFQVGKGNFQRDDGSEVYSTVMTEAYGDVDVEHVGPRYGPMSGQEMVYAVLKGRVMKNDLKIEVTESMTGWSHSVETFTKNGNVVYFQMPAFPYSQFDTMKANIIIYYKGDELSQTSYLYKGSLDQDLADLRLSDSYTTAPSSSFSKDFKPLDFFSATGVCPTSSRRTSTTKRAKRLNNKLKKEEH